VGGAQALEALKAAWRREPGAVFVRLGGALLSNGDLEEATAVLVDGLARWPHSLAGHVALAKVFAARGDVASAEASLATVLARDPEHWAALDLLASLRQKAGERAAEATLLRRLARQAPGQRHIARRLDLAERQVARRVAPAANAPGLIPPPTFRGPQFQSMPTRRLGALGTLSSPKGPRVTTAPSARRPVASTATTTNPQDEIPRMLRRSKVLRTSPGHRPAQPGIPRQSRRPDSPDPFANETMVELLVEQGRHEDARGLLAELIRREPGRLSLAHRLLELGGPGPDGGLEGRNSPADLEGLMRGVLSSAAAELDALDGGEREESER
jgi:predicted Zn-dependent protease